MHLLRLPCGSVCRLSLCLLLLAASVALLTTSAEAKPGHIRNKDDFESCGGALKCLGAQKLGRVRRRSGLGHKSVQEVAAQLDSDGDLELDDNAETLLYSCAGAIPDPADVAAAAADAENTAAAPDLAPVYDTAGVAAVAAVEAPHHHHHHHRHLSQTANNEIANGWTPDVPDSPIIEAAAFRLHSRPNAVKKILLDFTGHTTQNSWWNSGRAAQIITPPYDKDGSPTTWSAVELSDILAIWRSVSEDFAPWDVDVTTEDPGDAYLATNGLRVAIGGSSTDWYGSAGGVAYVGQFGKGLAPQPAFVFAVTLSNNPKFIWEAVSHETGHMLGLSHDGVAGGSAYYGGTTATPRLWAPIMGSSYYCAVTQWSKGEYNGANNLEDDIQIISGFLGPAYANDLVGDTLATATQLPATANAGGLTSTGTSYGVIQGPNDVDMFSFTATAAGTVQVVVTLPPRFGTQWAGARADLAVGVTVLDASSNVLAAASGLGVSTSVTVPAAGTYYVALSSVGMNDPASTGFSNYASAGQYKVTATYPSSTAAPTPSPPPPVPSPPPPVPSPPPPVPSPPPPVPSPPPPPPPVPSPPPPVPSPPPPVPSPPPPVPSPPPPPPPVPSPPPPVPSPPPPVPSPPPPPPPVPSPPPPPVPSPPPPPEPQLMTISAITNTLSFTGSSKVFCNARVTVVRSSDNAPIPNIQVTVQWSTTPSKAGWPYSTTSTSATNIASFRTTSLPSATGITCTPTVIAVVAAGFSLDPNAPRVGPTGSW